MTCLRRRLVAIVALLLVVVGGGLPAGAAAAYDYDVADREYVAQTRSASPFIDGQSVRLSAQEISHVEVPRAHLRLDVAFVAPSSSPGSYVPQRTLPTHKHGVPVPDVNLPHTQLGTSKPKYGSEPQAREWDYGPNGNLQPQRDIDFTDHGTPSIHPNPHQHVLTPNNPTLAPKGGYQRGPHQPL